MKKALLCVVVFLLIILGCSCKKQEIKPTVTGISFCADISYYNENYLCDVEIDSSGKMTLSATSPEDLKDLTLTYNGSDVTAEYMGISYTPKSGNMPLGNVAQQLYGIMKSVSQGAKAEASSDSNCTVEGKYNDKSFSFVFSPSGLPLSLEIPDSSFKILFKDVTVISEK